MSIAQFLPQGTTVVRRSGGNSSNPNGIEVYLAVQQYDMANQEFIGTNMATQTAFRIKLDSSAAKVGVGNRTAPKFEEFACEVGKIDKLLAAGIAYNDIKKSETLGRFTEPNGVIKFDGVVRDRATGVYIAKWARPISRREGDRIVVPKGNGLLLLRAPKWYDEVTKKTLEGEEIRKVLIERGENLLEVAEKTSYEGVVVYPRYSYMADSLGSFEAHFLAVFRTLQTKVINEAPACYMRFFDADGNPIEHACVTKNGNVPTDQVKLNENGQAEFDSEGKPIMKRVRRTPESVYERFMDSPFIDIHGNVYTNQNATSEDDKYAKNYPFFENFFASGGSVELMMAFSVRLAPKLVVNMAKDFLAGPGTARAHRFLTDVDFFKKSTFGVQVDSLINSETGEVTPKYSTRFDLINVHGACMPATSEDSKSLLMAELNAAKTHRIVTPMEINSTHYNNYDNADASGAVEGAGQTLSSIDTGDFDTSDAVDPSVLTHQSQQTASRGQVNGSRP